jgi:hypothetical protein
LTQGRGDHAKWCGCHLILGRIIDDHRKKLRGWIGTLPKKFMTNVKKGKKTPWTTTGQYSVAYCIFRIRNIFRDFFFLKK